MKEGDFYKKQNKTGETPTIMKIPWWPSAAVEKEGFVLDGGGQQL